MFAQAFQTAVQAGHDYVRNNAEPHWYPCGFAWLVAPKVRKNSKEGMAFAAAGFRWEDYTKRYTYGANGFTNTQCMDHKEAILQAVADSLNQNGFEGFYVSTRID